MSLNRNIAEALGWHGFLSAGGMLFGLRKGEPLGSTLSYVPDYEHDANACLNAIDPDETLIFESDIVGGVIVHVVWITDMWRGQGATWQQAFAKALLAKVRHGVR